jgi:hypothetical protein
VSTIRPFNHVLASVSELYNGSSARYRPLDAVDPATGAQAVALTVTDLGNGTYTLPYTAPQAGTYYLQLKLGIAGGLWATFYRGMGFKLPFEGRATQGLDLAWGAYGPVTGKTHGNTSVSSHEFFGMVVRGFLRVPDAAEYTFYLATDATAETRVLLGGREILFASARADTATNQSYFLREGQLYSLEIRYQHSTGEDPRCRLDWSTPRLPREVIAPSNLYLFYRLSNRTHYPLIVPAPLRPPVSTAVGKGLANGTRRFSGRARESLAGKGGYCVETGVRSCQSHVGHRGLAVQRADLGWSFCSI